MKDNVAQSIPACQNLFLSLLIFAGEISLPWAQTFKYINK